MQRIARRNLINLPLAAAVIACSLVPGLGYAQGVDPQPFRFGTVGLARGQTARLNVANLAMPDPGAPTPECMLMLGFADSRGMPLVDVIGEP
ncbi:MAG: hypothetical protein ACREUP_00645, partial [Burkholderiales bacterium]